MDWIEKNKIDLFGNMDFKSPMNELRYKNIKKQSNHEFICFNPIAFKLIYIGRYFLSIIIFLIMFPLIKKSNNIIIIIYVLYIFFLLYKGIRAYIKYKNTDTNFYDLYAREY